MENLREKRLLILGGTAWKNAIADFAKDNGVVLIAAGNNPDAKFFEIADESYVVSSTDADTMKKLIREKKIDGVHMGGNETVLTAACEYIRETGLPCYCTKAQWEAIQNKESFKNLCISAGLPVIPQIKIDETNLKFESEKLDYPVITKPIDGSGSNGFSVCRNPEDFLLGYKKALQNSKAGKVMVEKFVENESVSPFFVLSNGKPFFGGLVNRYHVFYDETRSYVSGLHLMKSPYTSDFCKRFEDKISNLFKLTDMREGFIWIEVFKSGENYYFNEAGYRYNGSMSFYPIDYFYGINSLYADLYYSLTGKSCIQGHRSLIPKSVARKKNYAIYALHLKPGKIAKIFGVDKLSEKENVITAAVTKCVGDVVENSGTRAQVFALIHFVFDTKNELEAMVDYIHEIVVVEGADGKNLVNRMLNIKNIATDFFEKQRESEA